MIRSLNVYLYAALLIIGAWSKLLRVTIDGIYQMLEEGRCRVGTSTINMMINAPVYPNDYQDKKTWRIGVRNEVIQWFRE